MAELLEQVNAAVVAFKHDVAVVPPARLAHALLVYAHPPAAAVAPVNTSPVPGRWRTPR